MQELSGVQEVVRKDLPSGLSTMCRIHLVRKTNWLLRILHAVELMSACRGIRNE